MKGMGKVMANLYSVVKLVLKVVGMPVLKFKYYMGSKF